MIRPCNLQSLGPGLVEPGVVGTALLSEGPPWGHLPQRGASRGADGRGEVACGGGAADGGAAGQKGFFVQAGLS